MRQAVPKLPFAGEISPAVQCDHRVPVSVQRVVTARPPSQAPIARTPLESRDVAEVTVGLCVTSRVPILIRNAHRHWCPGRGHVQSVATCYPALHRGAGYVDFPAQTRTKSLVPSSHPGIDAAPDDCNQAADGTTILAASGSAVSIGHCQLGYRQRPKALVAVRGRIWQRCSESVFLCAASLLSSTMPHSKSRSLPRPSSFRSAG